MHNLQPLAPGAVCIAAAQSPAVPGDMASNVQIHLAFVHAAARHRVQLLVFPELSLTGYELGLASQRVLHAEHPALAPLRQAARTHGITLVVGAPAAPATPGALPAIGAWVIGPLGGVALYRKRHLHEGEAANVSAGNENARVVTVADMPTALAVCADITHAEHARAAHHAGAALYACGVLISERGYAAEAALVQGYAQRHGMAALLANYSGASGGYASAGRSAVWDATGRCVAAAPGDAPSLVWAARDGATGAWRGGVAAVDLSAVERSGASAMQTFA